MWEECKLQMFGNIFRPCQFTTINITIFTPQISSPSIFRVLKRFRWARYERLEMYTEFRIAISCKAVSFIVKKVIRVKTFVRVVGE
jgi:hypothetical protein